MKKAKIILSVFMIFALLTSCGTVEKVEPVIKYDAKSEQFFGTGELVYIGEFGEEAAEEIKKEPEKMFWLDSIYLSRFALVAKLEDYYEDDGIGYWVFRGINLVYGDYIGDKVIIESGTKERPDIYLAFHKFEIGKSYLITVYTDKWCDYAPKCPYTLSGGTLIDIENPENSFWERGDIIFPEGTKKESIINYISDLAITYGYDGL